MKGSTDFKELTPEFYDGTGDFLVHRGVGRQVMVTLALSF